MVCSNPSRKSHSPSSPFTYQPHQPEKTTLYKLIQEHLLSFYQHIDNEQEKDLPDFVKKEFRYRKNKRYFLVDEDVSNGFFTTLNELK